MVMAIIHGSTTCLRRTCSTCLHALPSARRSRRLCRLARDQPPGVCPPGNQMCVPPSCILAEAAQDLGPWRSSGYLHVDPCPCGISIRPRTSDFGAFMAASRPSTTTTSPRPVTSFVQLGLPHRLVAALAEAGITEPFPIQAATIPDALAGRDLLGRGRTGSGKTYAFVLPLL